MSVITKLQIQTIQIARRQVQQKSGGVFDEGQFRMALLNVGGVRPDCNGRVSSKALDQAGFEQMMAMLEDMGFRDVSGKPDHWRSRVNGLATTRQVFEIKRLGAESRYSIESLCQRATGGKCTSPEQLTPKQAHGLIEALKNIGARESK